MSIKIMSAIFEGAGPDDPIDTFVLVAIADHANDDGLAYPSSPGIAAKTRLDVRTVQRAVKRLVDAGFLHVEYNAGPGGKNLFTVTPGTAPPPAERRPRQSAAKPPAQRRGTPGTAPPEPSDNHQEPSGGAEAPPPAVIEGPEKKKKTKRASQIGDWRPSDMEIQNAAATLFNSVSEKAISQVEDICARFVDHAEDKGRTSKNWSAAWRNWVAKEAEILARRK